MACSCAIRVGVTYVGFSSSSCAKALAEVAQKSGSGRHRSCVGLEFGGQVVLRAPGQPTLAGASLTPAPKKLNRLMFVSSVRGSFPVTRLSAVSASKPVGIVSSVWVSAVLVASW